MKIWELCAKLFGSYYTLFITIVAYLSAFIAGLSSAWTSPVLVKLYGTEDNPLGNPITPGEADLIGSILFVGAALGPLLVIKSIQYLGSRNTIIISNVPCLAGYAILIFAQKIEFVYFARFLIGLTIGGVTSVGPSYLSEIVLSAKKRGPYMAIISAAIQSGSLASYVIGPYVSYVQFNGLVLAISFVATLLLSVCCPESPHRILKTRDREAAKHILRELKIKNIEMELRQIESDIKEKSDNSLILLFSTMKYLKPFVMATTLLYLQLFSGIAILMTYNEQIFLKSDINIPTEQCSIIVGIIQVITAVLVTFTSSKCSRKSLLTFSLFGSAFFDLVLGLYFYFGESLTQFNLIPLVGLILFVVCYNSGLDPLPIVFLGEIYPPKIKTIGIASSVFLYWMGYYVQTFIFSKVHISFYFFGYAICCFCGIFYVRFKLTETKGKTLKEIQEIMIIGTKI